MSKHLLSKIKHELTHLLPVVAFFLVAFNVVAVCHGLMTKGYTKWGLGFGLATALALVVGKAVLVADTMPFLEVFRLKPLIYPTIWKASIYVVVAILLRYLELLAESDLRYHRLGLANEHVFAQTDWHRFWAVQIVLAIFLCAFAGVSELSRAMGNGELRRVFFGRRRG